MESISVSQWTSACKDEATGHDGLVYTGVWTAGVTVEECSGHNHSVAMH